MNKPVMHLQTERAIDRLSTAPVQSLLIVGPQGIGKDHLSQYIITRLLGIQSVTGHPYYLQISPSEKGSITIEEIRKLTDFLRLKVPGQEPWRRAVHISSAEVMTNEAQNALLKTLEEPPGETLIILTSSAPERLLRTIRSRVQQLTVDAPSESDIRESFSAGASKDFDKHLKLSGGLPGLLHALENQSDHTLVAAIEYAKQLMKSGYYERLVLADEIIKSTVTIQDLLWAVERIARIGQRAAADKANQTAVKKWHEIRSAADSLQKMNQAHPSQKLLLTSLSLHL